MDDIAVTEQTGGHCGGLVGLGEARPEERGVILQFSAALVTRQRAAPPPSGSAAG